MGSGPGYSLKDLRNEEIGTQRSMFDLLCSSDLDEEEENNCIPQKMSNPR